MKFLFKKAHYNYASSPFRDNIEYIYILSKGYCDCKKEWIKNKRTWWRGNPQSSAISNSIYHLSGFRIVAFSMEFLI